MSQFMLAIYYDPSLPSDGSPSRQPEHAKLGDEMRNRGHYLGGAGLLAVEHYVKRIYRRNQAPVMVDGPFTETKETIGGYFLVDCAEADALEYASRISVDNRSWVEVRKIFALVDR